MLAELTHTDFEPHIGTTFALQLNETEDLALELTQVSVSEHATPKMERRSFSLVFRSRLRGHAPQRIYSLVHPALGTFELFLVPIGPDAIGMQYQAVFG